MAMVKPIGVPLSAFDSTNNQQVSFTSTGGDQVVKNKLTIRLNSNNSIVYENTETTFSFFQTVPANTLTNGNYYNFTFITYDINNNASAESLPVSFYCYTAPTLTFNNLTNNQTITTASYNFELSYAQIEGELLDFLNVTLYDVNNNIISVSPNFYSSQNPPVLFDYLCEGLEDNTFYKIQANGVTINGTEFSSALLNFQVVYSTPVFYSVLFVDNNCDNGYNNVTTNIKIISGSSDPTPVNYVDDGTKADISIYGDYIKWDSNYTITNDFLLEIWYGIASIGKQFKIISQDNVDSYFIGNWVREIPYGETEVKDYVEIIGYINNVETFYMRSNYINIVNNTADIVLWFKYNPINNVYELILNTYNQVANVFEWNSTNNNLEYGRLTDIEYVGEDYTQGVQKDNVYGDMSSMFPLTKTEIYNGIYDNLDISYDINKEFTIIKPTWNYNTILNCDFNNNIEGGNTKVAMNTLSSIKIKAREYGTYAWITLYEKAINSIADLNIAYQDYRVPSGKTIQYALVPVSEGNIEGDYVIVDVVTKWNKIFVTDETTTLSLFPNVSYGETVSNINVGMLMPINSKYPIVIKNSNTDYESGSITGLIVNSNLPKNFNSLQTVELMKQWKTMLKNGKPKIIKDYNGNIWIGRIIDSPTNSYFANFGNKMGQISFSYAEQAKWDNQTELERVNLIITE
jgi:hypothetical protein